MENYVWTNRKILIAEDEEANFLFIEAILEDTQATLIWAQNGMEAVDKVNENIDIDIILMDVKMPEMDGLAATRIIKKINKNIPIIAQTAYAMVEDKSKCINAGCDEYITKPINQGLLLSVIDKYFTNLKMSL